MLCLITHTAVPGVFPLIFTKRGSSKSLAWLSNIGAVGDTAYTNLKSLVSAGEFQLPKFITIIQLDGFKIHLEPPLTTPTRSSVLCKYTIQNREFDIRVIKNKNDKDDELNYGEKRRLNIEDFSDTDSADFFIVRIYFTAPMVLKILFWKVA